MLSHENLFVLRIMSVLRFHTIEKLNKYTLYTIILFKYNVYDVYKTDYCTYIFIFFKILHNIILWVNI